ncbi:MAG: glycosyltransferase family 2 protein, partial [Desulfitobacterium hafniense]
LEDTYRQAQDFLHIYEKELPAYLLDACRYFTSLPRMNKLQRIRCLHQFDFWKSGAARKIGQLLFI